MEGSSSGGDRRWIVKDRRLRGNHILSPFGVDDDPFFDVRMGIRVGCAPGLREAVSGKAQHYGPINFNSKGPIGAPEWQIIMSAI